MKKSALLILVCILTIFSLVGCSLVNAGYAYKQLNLLVENTKSYHLSVRTATLGESLESTYDVTYTEGGYNVSYSYEVLNALDINSDIEEYKSVKSGEAVIENSSVVSYTGDEINALPGVLKLSFDKDFFDDVESTDSTFDAIVTDTEGFFGSAVAGTDITVSIEYSLASFTFIVIGYETEHSSVSMLYTFD